MARVWTHGIWHVKAGREDEFVAAWRGLLEIAADFGGVDPTLLRERENPSVFRSFGAWPDVETIERFRSAAFPRIAEFEDMLESFEPLTLDEVYPGG